MISLNEWVYSTNGGISMNQEQRNKTVDVNIKIPEKVINDFLYALERNGKSMNDVLRLYMQKYIWKQGELQRNRYLRRQSIGNNR